MLDTQDIFEAVEKGKLDKAHLAIGWKANGWGYSVAVINTAKSQAVYEYTAGNSPWDSQQSVAAEGGVGEAQLKEWALQTAKEFANEIDLPQSVVFEEED